MRKRKQVKQKDVLQPCLSIVTTRYLQTFIMFLLLSLFMLTLKNPNGPWVSVPWIITSSSSLSSSTKLSNHTDKILLALKNLDEEMEGDIVLVSTKEKFRKAAQIWQEIPPPPLAVVEVASAEDVIKAVPILAGLVRDFGIDLRIKSGGHSFNAEYSTIPNGVVLSLTKLDRLEVNTTNHTAIFEPGVRVESFLQQTLDQNGLVGIVADAAHVGMVGFVLGGGYGYQSRMYGLASDNVIRLRTVLINGTVLDLVPGDELFWALLGTGGCNFGVVVQIEYRLYPSKDMKLGVSVQLSRTELFDFLQKLGQKEPELAGEFTVSVHRAHFWPNDTSPNHNIIDVWKNPSLMNDSATVSMYWMGDSGPEQPIGMEYIKTNILPLISSPVDANFYYFSWSGITREKEQAELLHTVFAAQTWNGFLLPQNNTKSVWQSLQKDLLTMLRYCSHLTPNIVLWGGAIDLPPNSTINNGTFAYRSAVYNVGVQLMVPNGTANAKNVFQDESALVSAVWPSIAQHLTGVYVNYPMASLTKQEYPKAYWGDNLERLMDVKKNYDPYNILKSGQSIPLKVHKTLEQNN